MKTIALAILLIVLVGLAFYLLLIRPEKQLQAQVVQQGQRQHEAFERQMVQRLLATPGVEVWYSDDGSINFAVPGSLTAKGCSPAGPGAVSCTGNLTRGD